jgi:hypothetical protein
MHGTENLKALLYLATPVRTQQVPMYWQIVTVSEDLYVLSSVAEIFLEMAQFTLKYFLASLTDCS